MLVYRPSLVRSLIIPPWFISQYWAQPAPSIIGFPRMLVVGPSRIHQWTGPNATMLGLDHMGRSWLPEPEPL